VGWPQLRHAFPGVRVTALGAEEGDFALFTADMSQRGPACRLHAPFSGPPPPTARGGSGTTRFVWEGVQTPGVVGGRSTPLAFSLYDKGERGRREGSGTPLPPSERGSQTSLPPTLSFPCKPGDLSLLPLFHLEERSFKPTVHRSPLRFPFHLFYTWIVNPPPFAAFHPHVTPSNPKPISTPSPLLISTLTPIHRSICIP